MRLLKRGAARASHEAAPHPPAKLENGTATPLFRQEVVEFQRTSRDWGRVVPLQPIVTRASVWLVVFGVAAAVGVSFVAEYARKAVAMGYLRPAAGSARIFVPQQGVIKTVYVTEGQQVDAGQPLFAVSTGQFTGAGLDVNATILASLRDHIQSLKAQIGVEQQRTDSERARLTAQVQTLEGEVNAMTDEVAVQARRIGLYERIVTSGAYLVGKGLVSEVEQRRREDGVLEQRRALHSLTEQVLARQGQLSDARYTLQQLPLVHQEKIRSLTSDLTTTEQRVAEVSGRDSYVVRAPIGGEVALLEASVGQPAEPKRLQAEIVPKDHRLLAEAFVPAHSIGQVQTGQSVRIRYDTFPYQKYGVFKGTVTQVSHTALTSADNLMTPVPLKDTSYRITIALDRSDVTVNGKSVPLQPDMLLRADILLEKHTLAQWTITSLRMPG